MFIRSINIPEEHKPYLTNYKYYEVVDKIDDNLVYVIDDNSNRRCINLSNEYYGIWWVT